MADVKAVANLFLHLAEKQATEEAGDLMTDLKLQKMLYFAQCWHLVRYDEPMFQNVIEAWDHGPVVPEIYSEYKQYGRNPIQASPVDYDAFSNQELETIMDVFAYYGRYSASGLREISHQYDSPWANAYKPGLKHLEITQESMKDFYKRQPPLETLSDRILRTAKEKGIEIIEPMISPNGNPVLPADDYEDWGDWDDD